MNAKLVQLLALAVTVVLIATASRFTPSINRTREQLDMMGSTEVLAKTPPEYAFAVQAFGAFRGLLTNIAFIRADKMKEQGRYYDAMQLANWICKLQPRFPTVWEFQSWNMAWNISITAHTPEERWNWVYNGVRLIRDEGLDYNPRAINLYKQLAWTFVNKMSETTDEYHLHFKRAWAWRMHLVLGSPPDPLGDYRPGETLPPLESSIGRNDPLVQAAAFEAERRIKVLQERIDRFNYEFDKRSQQIARDILAGLQAEQQAAGEQTPAESPLNFYTVATRAAYDRLIEIAGAPDTLAELYAAHPAAETMARELSSIGVRLSDDRLVEEQYWADGVGLAWTFFYRYRLLTEPRGLLQTIEKEAEQDPDQPNIERLGAILRIAEADPAGKALERFLQKKVLREVYRLDPRRMAEITARFGPIDWRMVDAHSLYWVNEGLVAGGETIGRFQNDKTNTARMVFFSLRNLMNKNRLVFEPYTRNVNYAYMNFNPDVNFIEPMHRAFLNYGRLFDPDPEAKGAGATYRSGHINFLAEAIRMLYFAGREAEAEHYYEYLRTEYGKLENGLPNPGLRKPLRDFVIDSLRENEGIQRDTRAAINALLAQAWQQLTTGNIGNYNMLETAARTAHHDYNADKQNERIEKVALPEFENMKVDSLIAWLREPGLYAEILIHKARLWTYLPLAGAGGPALRLKVYDLVQPQLARECENFGFDVAKAFPEPPGLEQYRAENPDRAKLPEQTGIDTPTQPR